MRFVGFLLLSCFMFHSSIGQTTRPNAPLPTGTVQVAPSLYFDETEVTNIHWLEFLHYLQQDTASAKWQAALPDTTVWKTQQMSELGAYRDYYLRYPGFRFHPVVGISLEQAQAYCAWRSMVVTAEFEAKKSKKYVDWYVSFHYRLPTALEWEAVAIIPEKEVVRGDAPFPTYVYEHPPNDLGLYGIQSNVAEMVEHGIIKGPNAVIWHQKYNSQTEIPFATPDHYTGFRCACEVSLSPIKEERSEPIKPKASKDFYDVDNESHTKVHQQPLLAYQKESKQLDVTFNWTADFQRLSIYDQEHRLIARYPLLAINKQSIALGCLTPGIYRVIIEDGISTFSEKIIINHL